MIQSHLEPSMKVLREEKDDLDNNLNKFYKIKEFYPSPIKRQSLKDSKCTSNIQ